MGSGISTSEEVIAKQEHFVRSNFDKTKQTMSVYKSDGHNRFTDKQIRMKLRQEYYNTPHGNRYIADIEWKNRNKI